MLTTAATGERRRWGSAAWTRKNGLSDVDEEVLVELGLAPLVERVRAAGAGVVDDRVDAGRARRPSSRRARRPPPEARGRTAPPAPVPPPPRSRRRPRPAARPAAPPRRPSAPRPASATAAARPMPVPPPVTIATAPSRSLAAAVIGSWNQNEGRCASSSGVSGRSSAARPAAWSHLSLPSIGKERDHGNPQHGPHPDHDRAPLERCRRERVERLVEQDDHRDRGRDREHARA